MNSEGTPLLEAKTFLSDRLERNIQSEVPLGAMTTYRVGGNAAIFVDVSNIDDLAAVGEAHSKFGVPVLVVGRGSNMLVSDEGFAGIVVSIAEFADQIEFPEEVPPVGGKVEVIAGGGVALPVLARRTAARGITGFEWAVGVPGSVGGAVRMNAGGHGSDMSASVAQVLVFDLGSPQSEPRLLQVAELGLRFRASDLAADHIVINARLVLRAGDVAVSEAEITEVVRWRRDNQPGGQNCGSVFVNPVPGEVTSGALIDDLGLRGFRIGTAWVSEKHANFIQSSEGGNASDVRQVIEAVRSKVAEATGYELRSEVRLVGFGDTDPMSFATRRLGT